MNRRNLTGWGYALALPIAVIASYFYLTAAAVSLGVVAGIYAVALVLGGAHPGSKTSLQCIFGAIGFFLATCCLAFGWGWGGWAGVGVCAFLVWSMKLDGGDEYGG